jgi:predicted nucleic acid-binding protein
MKISQYVAVLDTCVLAPMPVADTLLRLAEEPAFYIPRWSPGIFEELRRTLQEKFRYSQTQVDRRIRAMESMFPDAMVTGYDNLIASMTNDPKDRHVLAAAVKCGAQSIISNNARHFPQESLAPYGLQCLTADDFLKHQYHLNPDAFISVLTEQAGDIGWTLLQLLSRHVPSLSKLIVAR